METGPRVLLLTALLALLPGCAWLRGSDEAAVAAAEEPGAAEPEAAGAAPPKVIEPEV